MLKRIEKYLALIGIALRTEWRYTTNMVASNIGVLLRIWILAELYAVALRGSATQEVQQVVWVLALTQCFGVVGYFWLDRTISTEVKSGAIAYILLKPCSYVLQQFSTGLGKALAVLPLALLLGSIFCCILVGAPSLSLAGVVIGSLMLLLGFALHLLIGILIGLSSFWVEDTSAFSWLYHKAWIILGGMVIPLSLLPDWARTGSELLPFGLVFHAAARMIVSFDLSLCIRLLGLQILWLVLIGTVLQLSFSAALRRLSINGG